MAFDPVSISIYLELGAKAWELFQRLRDAAKASGATDEQLAAITGDYDVRIARRRAESGTA